MLFVYIAPKVGDTIISTGFFQSLKNKYPEIKIDVFIPKPYTVLLEHNTNIDKIYVKDQNFFSLIFNLFSIFSKKYDVAVVQSTIVTLKRKIFLLLLGTKKIIHIAYPDNAHISKGYNNVLKELGVKNINYPPYSVLIPLEKKKRIISFLNRIRNKKVIIFNPIGSEQNRILSEQTIKAIIALLQQYKDYAIFLLDYKKMYNITEKNVFSWTSNSILETAALISKADFVISVDTGIVHIADAFNKKIIDIFPATFTTGQPLPKDHILRWEPRGPHKNIVGNPFVDDISLEDLKRSLTELLTYE